MAAGFGPGDLVDFDAALRLNPGMAAAYNNRGTTRHQLGDLIGAGEDFDAALQLAPANAEIQSNRGAVRADLGDLVGAEVDCRRAKALAPDNAQVHARLGLVFQERKDWPAALAAYDRALELNPRLFWVYILRGHARYHTGDGDGLCGDYKKAFTLERTRSAALAIRALRRGLEKDSEKAIHDCEEHLQRSPQDPTSLARRGLLLVLLDRRSEAESDLARCRELYPESTPYLDLLIQEATKRSVNSLMRGWETVVNERPAAEVAKELGMTVNAVYLAKGRVLSHLRNDLQGLLD